jgi:hypothetical protein
MDQVRGINGFQRIDQGPNEPKKEVNPIKKFLMKVSRSKRLITLSSIRKINGLFTQNIKTKTPKY